MRIGEPTSTISLENICVSIETIGEEDIRMPIGVEIACLHFHRRHRHSERARGYAIRGFQSPSWQENKRSPPR
jgi:hypothetical protein